MSGDIQLDGESFNRKAGKDPKATAKFVGNINGVECVVMFKALSRDNIEGIIPLVYGRLLELKITDPQTIFEEFQEKDPAILEDFILGFPIEKAFVAGNCTECGSEMWVDPDEDKPICDTCKKEIANEKFRKDRREWSKHKRTSSNAETTSPVILRLPDETLEEYEARKQLIQDELFREERISRAEVQA